MDTTLPAVLQENAFLPMEFLSGTLVTRCTNEIAVLQTANVLVEKAHNERINKRFRQALELYEKALTVDPAHEVALFWAGFCLLPNKERKAVIDELYGSRWRVAVNRSTGYYRKLIRTKEENKDKTLVEASACHVNLGVGYDFLDKTGDAEECWQKAVDLSGDNVALSNIGMLRNRAGNYDEAIVLFNKSIAKDKTFATPYFFLGKIRMRRSESDLALRCFELFLVYADREAPWEKENISFASDYVDFHSMPSAAHIKAAQKQREKKEAKMENTVEKDPAKDPGTAIESGIPHTLDDEKELYELFLTCWDQSVCSPSYVKKSWKDMREFFWRFGWRI